jgi:hypothetical protein
VTFCAVLCLAASFGPESAAAQTSVCRTDPIVALSNGVTVKITASIADYSSDVQHVSYVLHAPAGTSVTKVTLTGGPFAARESFSFYSDGAVHTYDTDTVVTTGRAGVAVTATTAVHSTTSVTRSTSGTDRQHLLVYLAA